MSPIDAAMLAWANAMLDGEHKPDAIELQVMAEYDGVSGPTIAPYNPAELEPPFYSVYLHRKDWGVDHMEDFNDVDAARDFARELAKRTGLVINDFISHLVRSLN